jgi:hypothetical protein
MPAGRKLRGTQNLQSCAGRAAFWPFGQGPGNIAVFAAIYEIIRKLNHMLLVCHYFGPQEDLGTSCILSAFTEDADKIECTVIDDGLVSDGSVS